MYLKCSRNKVEMSEEEIFRKFWPYCAVLASQPSAECLAKLAALCDDTAAAELELVQEYLVFPAQLHLKTRAAGTPRNFTFKDLLTSCLALLAPGAGEDLQLSLCSTLTQLLAAARGAVAEEMADPVNEMKLPLSHLVFSEHVEQRGAHQRSPCPCCGGCSASTRGGRARSSPAPASPVIASRTRSRALGANTPERVK